MIENKFFIGQKVSWCAVPVGFVGQKPGGFGVVNAIATHNGDGRLIYQIIMDHPQSHQHYTWAGFAYEPELQAASDQAVSQ